ncbi:hypothetical protein CR513_18035, partial [Mucuna pruriens]
MEDKRWRQAMEEEIKVIKKNDTWELSNLPKGYEAIGVKLVERYKARLVAKGYKQQHEVDYDEVFALENVYVEQPMGFAIKGQEKVLKLKKALYGLKQAPRAWNSRIDKYFQDNEFVHCQHEYALYVKNFDNDDILLICLYVDDLIFTRNNLNLFENFKKVMSCKFEMTDIRLMPYYLGLEVKQMNNGIFVSQENYAKKV